MHIFHHLGSLPVWGYSLMATKLICNPPRRILLRDSSGWLQVRQMHILHWYVGDLLHICLFPLVRCIKVKYKICIVWKSVHVSLFLSLILLHCTLNLSLLCVYYGIFQTLSLGTLCFSTSRGTAASNRTRWAWRKTAWMKWFCQVECSIGEWKGV